MDDVTIKYTYLTVTTIWFEADKIVVLTLRKMSNFGEFSRTFY